MVWTWCDDSCEGSSLSNCCKNNWCW